MPQPHIPLATVRECECSNGQMGFFQNNPRHRTEKSKHLENMEPADKRSYFPICAFYLYPENRKYKVVIGLGQRES